MHITRVKGCNPVLNTPKFDISDVGLIFMFMDLRYKSITAYKNIIVKLITLQIVVRNCFS